MDSVKYNVKPSFAKRCAIALAAFFAPFYKFRSSEKMRKIGGFFYSPLYVYAVGLVTLALNLAGADGFAYLFLSLAASVSLVLCPDALPFFCPLAFTTVARSLSSRVSAQESARVGYTSLTYALIGIAIAIVALAAIFHILVNFSPRRVKGSKLILGYVLLCAGLVCNGFFCDGYRYANLLRGLGIAAEIFGAYFAVRAFVRPTRDTLRYFAYIGFVYALVAGIQLCCFYVFHKPFTESGYSKDCLFLGWGLSNTIGETIFRGLPLCFYLICTEEKHCWYYFAAAVCMLVCIVFTFARASLAVAVPVFLLCYVLCCIFGRNRKQVVLCGVIFLSAAVIVLLSMRDKLGAMLSFFTDNGLNDRGRFSLWDLAVKKFLAFPVFGGGLCGTYESYGTLFFYHNTLLQFLGGGGLVGIGTYLFHRMQTLALFTRKPTLDRTFLAVLTASILCISLLDCFYMRLPVQIFLGLAIALAERDLEAADTGAC